jgi:hypothetical protein
MAILIVLKNPFALRENGPAPTYQNQAELPFFVRPGKIFVFISKTLAFLWKTVYHRKRKKSRGIFKIIPISITERE